MNSDFDLQEVIDFIDTDVYVRLVWAQDYLEECNKLNKKSELPPDEEDKLSHILDLLKEKSYKEAFILFLELFDNGTHYQQSRINMLKKYAAYLGVDSEILDSMVSFEDAVAKGLIIIPGNYDK